MVQEERGKVRVRLFGPISWFFGGLSEVEVEAKTVREALLKLEEEFKDFRGRPCKNFMSSSFKKTFM